MILSRAIQTLFFSCLLLSPLCGQATLSPLSGFGSGGWLAPGTPYLGTTGTERGLAYNRLTGNLLLVTSQNIGTFAVEVRIFDGATGVGGQALSGGGVTGGALSINMIDVADDGAIYVCNQVTNGSTRLTVYKHDSEAIGVTTPPTQVFDETTGVAQCGDSFAVFSGNATSPARFAAAGINSLNVGNFLVGTLDGSGVKTTFLSVPGTNTSSNDYGLSLSFVDANTLLGCQGGVVRRTDFQFGSGSATVTASIPLGQAGRRIVDYAVIGGRPMLAVLNTNNSNVAVFDLNDPAAPVVIAQANNTTGSLSPNTLGTGSVAWGDINGGTAALYVMSTNQGIQAFELTLSSAATTTFGSGCEGLGLQFSGQPQLGNAAFALAVTGLPVPALPVSWVAFGSATVNPGLDLAAIGMAGCFAYTNLDIGIFQTSSPSGNGALLPLPIPNDLALVGGLLSAQGLAFSNTSTLGLAASNGGSLMIGF